MTQTRPYLGGGVLKVRVMDSALPMCGSVGPSRAGEDYLSVSERFVDHHVISACFRTCSSPGVLRTITISYELQLAERSEEKEYPARVAGQGKENCVIFLVGITGA